MSALAIASLGTVLLSRIALAQENEDPNVAFIEIFGCTYNANNDMDDLMSVAGQFNRWADQRNVTSYSAQILTPYYYSEAFPYEVLWLGVYPNAEAMGAGEAQWLAEGGQINAAFAEVVTCALHAQFAGLAANIPAQPPAESDAVGLLAFRDCTLANERTIPEAVQAHGEWGDFLAERGSDLFMGMLIPIAGENPSVEYHYKSVIGYASAVAYGQSLTALGNGGLQRADEIFGRTVDCDIPRIYTTTSVREMADDN